MRYRGYTLETQYLPGTDCRLDKTTQRWVPRTPTKQDVDYVRAIPDDGTPALNCANMAEAKAWAYKWPCAARGEVT